VQNKWEDIIPLKLYKAWLPPSLIEERRRRKNQEEIIGKN